MNKKAEPYRHKTTGAYRSQRLVVPVLSFFLLLLLYIFAGCKTAPEKKDYLFEAKDADKTGLHFSNDLSYDQRFNLFKYIYFYNGSGVGAGDFNNDGLIDLFFASNQHENKLFLNSSKLQFRDITKEAKIPQDSGWSTGVSVVDINDDGLLDIYVCRVGNYEILHSRNQLLINQGTGADGIPVFKDEAQAYGLDFSGFSTQAAFFDFDGDGDLDMFLLNHSVHENGTFRPRKDFLNTYHLLSGDRLYRNDGKTFTDITRQCGINSTAIGYGLGIAVADINLDGYPDIYIGNDFHEDDYLYINQKNGTFKEEGVDAMMHTSQFSMGVDVADINNDAWPEVVSVDMLPADPYILKRSLGEDTYDIFNYKISVGYTYQYTRNNLQYNRCNGLFSETGLYSGVAATDWSWAPLWVDFDNDGLKDLFISNGIPKRMNDIDYINFVSNTEVQQKIIDNNMKDKDIALINKFPEIKLPNKFYHNQGQLAFKDEEAFVKGNDPSFSNGAVYADLDNDGDLDIVVNNINAEVVLYENKKNTSGDSSSMRLKLKGPAGNGNAIGAKAIVFAGKEIRTYDKFPVKGFLSSMEMPLLIGTGGTPIDSVLVVWPDNTYQVLDSVKPGKTLTVLHRKDARPFDYGRLVKQVAGNASTFDDVTAASGVDFIHRENYFSEFDREPLIPHMFSTEGPAVAVADINKDGLDDIYLGAARNGRSKIFLQQANGKFIAKEQPAFVADSIYENVSAVWTDVNKDGSPDLVVASGGNDFYGKDFHNSPRVYLNDGRGELVRKPDAFDSIYLTASCVVATDFNGDGAPDLFIGARTEPWEYGQVPRSYLLQNDGTGKFTDVTNQLAPNLGLAGFVTNAVWFDLDKDGDQDLLLSLEWGGIVAYMNDKGKFTEKILSDKNGWWNFILPCDIDNDGDIDLVAGNLGLNSRLKASVKEPVCMYFNDFDGNGKKEQVLTYFVAGREIPFASKAELEKQMPLLKKKFLYAENFAKASLDELFGDKLKTANKFSATYFSNALLINNGNLGFETKALPYEAQLTPFKDAVIIDANGDSLPDILMAGNYYGNNIEMGRYDADFGSVLINKGNGNFEYEAMKGTTVKGEVRHIQPVNINRKPSWLFVKNNDTTKLILRRGK